VLKYIKQNGLKADNRFLRYDRFLSMLNDRKFDGKQHAARLVHLYHKTKDDPMDFDSFVVVFRKHINVVMRATPQHHYTYPWVAKTISECNSLKSQIHVFMPDGTMSALFKYGNDPKVLYLWALEQKAISINHLALHYDKLGYHATASTLFKLVCHLDHARNNDLAIDLINGGYSDIAKFKLR
jgi:hypothetical protein